ncbi:hypothetical protein COOONC_13191 [Cooperia oncophora]
MIPSRVEIILGKIVTSAQIQPLDLCPYSKALQLLSRLRPAKKKQAPAPRPQVRQQIPDLEEFLIKKDYSAAISLLEFKQKNGEKNETTDLWLGHCFFRSGDYKRALDVSD